jgi:hypothetical protein
VNRFALSVIDWTSVVPQDPLRLGAAHIEKRRRTRALIHRVDHSLRGP